MEPTPSVDWKHLLGHTVELRRDDTHIRYGKVEDVSGDASLMWIGFHGTDGRQLIMKTDGYRLRLID